ncbi:CD3324 family protein [Paenibacillus sp. FSL M7-1455]|uniref:Mor transcription activator domain-containing protein n=1 Tax=Paenibacillus cookii TaxID=157839 RepID=A0ABQ4M3L1_9BACL|nr:CD3324 family protein [Paenibacillus cookii]GIO70120.1 hypothetical protein J21TS3_49410 [Paenibacillus cookii]
MKYINAESVFPRRLLEELQQYVQGGWVYVPTLKHSRTAWGERSGNKEALRRRNAEMKSRFSGGESIERLSSEYGLAYDTVKKIVYSKM